MTTTPPVPEGHCPECTTAKIPPGVPRCHACGLLRKLGRPTSPFTPTDQQEADA